MSFRRRARRLFLSSKYSLMIKILSYVALFALVFISFFALIKLPDDGIDVGKNVKYFENVSLSLDGETVRFTNHERVYLHGKQAKASFSIDAKKVVGNSIFFRTDFVEVKVYLNNELIFDNYNKTSRLFGKAPSSCYLLVDVPSDIEGIAFFEIEYFSKLDNREMQISAIEYGRSADMVISVIKANMISIVYGCALVFFSLFLFIEDIIVRKTKPDFYSMSYIAAFTFLCGLWVVAESQVIQILISNSGFGYYMSYTALMLMCIPIYLELKELYKPNFQGLFGIFALLSFASCFILTILHVFTIADFRETVWVTDLIIVISFIAYSFAFVDKHIVRRQKMSIFNWGIIIMMGFAIFEIMNKYITRDSRIYGASFKIGLLFFITLFLIDVFKRTGYTFRSKGRSDVLSSIAYIDSLTGIYNRRKYDEAIYQASRSKDKTMRFAVVMFDVNNLKIINDQYGHAKGDELLQAAAKIIRYNFGNYGQVFRIGGDEFAVIMKEYILPTTIDSVISKVNDLAEETYICDKAISIASGYAILNPLNHNRVDDVLKEADEKMYQKKKIQKGLLGTNVCL